MPDNRVRRKSPLGYDEFKGNVPETSKAVTNKDLSGETYSVYDPGYYDNPETQAHERIHQGQLQLKYNASIEQIKNILSKQMFDYANQGNGTYNNLEIPAYAFSHDDTDVLGVGQQQSYNNYINLSNRLNPGQAYNLVAPSPLALQKGYINSGPQVTPMQNTQSVEPQHMDYISLIHQMIQARKR